MAEHNVLTGSSLHEPKGVAAAAANRVYVSDGAGSGSWSTITNSALDSTAKAFGAQLLHVQDQKTSGTEGGTFTSGSWQTRTLNTSVTNEITSASLSSNHISLPAGTYWLEATAQANRTNAHQLRIYNITDSSLILTGLGSLSNQGAEYVCLSAHVYGRFTLASTKSIELQHQCQNSRSTDGFGAACNFGTEVYADVKIWKIA